MVLKNLKIRNKILLGFAVVLLICALSIVISYTTIMGQIKQFNSFVNNTVYGLNLVKDIRFEDITLTDCLRGVIINAYSTDDRNKYSDYATLLDQKLKEAKVIADTDEEKKIFEEYNTYNQKLVELETKMMDPNTNQSEILSIFHGEYSTYRKLFTDSLNKFEQIQQDNMNSTIKLISDTMNKSAVLVLVFFSISVLLGIVMSIFIASIIGKPVNKLVEAADKLAVGDINVNAEANTNDEIGKLTKSFARMISNIREQAVAAERIAAGDLTVKVAVKSENDLLGKNLSEMVEKNNEVLTNITSAAEQVAAGSKQLSDSSMALSQGATEQASSIEELTASIEEISSQAELNAQNANQANELAETAKTNAAYGNAQMKEMLKAMEEINESSSNISKIIKVIDGIAFQTNILALNAAVEAARAGQHGKGFAVVAEEVRNLAARSANAAKETTEMIEGSIKKVKGGTRIANDTADALNKIVDDVAKAADLVGDIAVASNEQVAGIVQVNQGVMQVSQVVQTNAAASQESAAVSEELSSQATLLNEMVGGFKLKQNTKIYGKLDEISPEVLKMVEDKPEKETDETRQIEEVFEGAVDLEPTIILSEEELANISGTGNE